MSSVVSTGESQTILLALKALWGLVCAFGLIIITMLGYYITGMNTNIQHAHKEIVILKAGQSKLEAEYMSFDGRLGDFDARVIRLEDKY